MLNFRKPLSLAAIGVALSVVFSGLTPAYAAPMWKASYWNNRTLKGTPVVLDQPEAQINYNWHRKSPIPGTVNIDNFSVRWTGTANLPPGSYEFRTASDDGIRVYMDNKLIINQWNDHPYQTYFVVMDVKDLTATPGVHDHTFKVEYYEDKGYAAAKFTWEPTKVDAWDAQYFSGTDQAGNIKLERSENKINNYWRRVSPGPGVPAMNFSVVWTRSLVLPAGQTTFHVTTSDGAQLYVEDDSANLTLIIDQWYDHGVETHGGKIKHKFAGTYDVELDFYNHSDPAAIVLTWTSP